MKRFHIIITVLVLFASVILAQDTIRGTYTYTFGDSESLVDARKTCKDLALREAIESYALFVESCSEVENFEVKEDVITSIAAGVLKNVTIVDQQEEGRTIILTVEATVEPEEVSQLLEEAKAAHVVDAAPDAERALPTEEATSKSESASRLYRVLGEYEKRMQTTEDAWNSKRFDVAAAQIREVKKLLDDSRPDAGHPFVSLLFNAASTHLALLGDLFRAVRLEGENKPVQARIARRQARQKADNLRGQIVQLEKMDSLTDRQILLRTKALSRFRRALLLVLARRSR